ncbi:MAG: 30S ribosomal protein S6 [Candidatus Pacebacteria bacterium CG_4_10_14_0_8_um_filter_42_14]|nr:MAG: 30S ribosomal protein S6 [Candidatus Pacebacteria bacterium CG_4_10_14_0_8_um_filter_42_14]
MSMKLLPKNETRLYEMTSLIPASLTSEEFEKVKAEILAVLKKYKAEVKNQEDWGKQSLAYTIKKAGTRYDEARYIHWLIEMLPSAVLKIDTDLRHSVTSLIRHLIVLEEKEQPKTEEVAAEPVENEERE